MPRRCMLARQSSGALGALLAAALALACATGNANSGATNAPADAQPVAKPAIEDGSPSRPAAARNTPNPPVPTDRPSSQAIAAAWEREGLVVLRMMQVRIVRQAQRAGLEALALLSDGTLADLAPVIGFAEGALMELTFFKPEDFRFALERADPLGFTITATSTARYGPKGTCTINQDGMITGPE